MPLETVFHQITMPKLKHIGLHCWNLESDEIIDLLERHKKSLRSVRLRNITLRSGRWKEVLEYIRLNLGLRFNPPRLKWISLNGVGYNTGLLGPIHPLNVAGMQFAPAPIGNPLYNTAGSETDSDDIDSDDFSSSNEGTLSSPDDNSDARSAGTHERSHPSSEDEQHHPDSDEGSEHAHEHENEPEHDEFDHESDVAEFHGVNIGNEPSSPIYQHDYSNSNCECGVGFAFSDLYEDGVIVTREQWKKWQQWCCKPCVWHDPRQNSSE